MNKPRSIIFSVHQGGSPQFPRWMISDSFLRYFDGESWTPNQAKALLFATSNEACVEVQRLLSIPHEEQSVRRYRAPVYLDLFANEEIPLDQLMAWLFRVSKLLMAPDDYGLGPQPDTLGNISIEWSELELIEPKGA